MQSDPTPIEDPADLEIPEEGKAFSGQRVTRVLKKKYPQLFKTDDLENMKVPFAVIRDYIRDNDPIILKKADICNACNIALEHHPKLVWAGRTLVRACNEHFFWLGDA